MVRITVDSNMVSRDSEGRIAILLRQDVKIDDWYETRHGDEWRFNPELIEVVNEIIEGGRDVEYLFRNVDFLEELVEKHSLRNYGILEQDLWNLKLEFVSAGREFVVLDKITGFCHFTPLRTEYVQYLPLPPPENKKIFCF